MSHCRIGENNLDTIKSRPKNAGSRLVRVNDVWLQSARIGRHAATLPEPLAMRNEKQLSSTAVGKPLPEILFVTSTLQVGGTQLHIVEIAQSLVRRGWRVSVYAVIEGGPLCDVLRQGNVTVLLPPVASEEEACSRVRRALRLLHAAARLFAVMARRRPAIVHLVLPVAYLIGAPLALLAGVPIRVMSRRSLNVYQRHDWRYRLVEPALHRTMSAILGNSQSIIRELRDRERVPAGRLGLIYSGIDGSRFADTNSRPKVRDQLSLAPTTIALVVVANLFPFKGHADLISALALAQPQMPADWRLLLVGRDYGIESDLRAQAAKLRVDGKISFLGPRSDVPEILTACDLGLLCSHEEGFSHAILEGMAAGLPMIVTDVGGNPEAVIDGETGLIVPPRDPARLAQAIIRLAADPALRAKLGTAGRRRVQEHFALDRCVEAYERLYRELLAGGTPQNVPQLRVAD